MYTMLNLLMDRVDLREFLIDCVELLNPCPFYVFFSILVGVNQNSKLHL